MNLMSPETRMMGLPYGTEIMIVGRTMWTRDERTDGQIDKQTDRITITKTVQRIRSHGKTRKLCYRQDDRAMRPTHGCPENFLDSLTRLCPRQLFPTFSWAFIPIDSMNVRTKFEVHSFTRSWDNRVYPKKLGSPWIRPRSLFSKFLMGFYSDRPC